jgi:hypothetical protein
VALDAQEFNSSRNSSVSDGKTYLPNDYAHSSLRSYLNGTFLNRAFDISAQQFIFSDTVDNSLASAKDKAGALTPDNVFCEDTQDKVFPLSIRTTLFWITTPCPAPKTGMTPKSIITGSECLSPRRKKLSGRGCSVIAISTLSPKLKFTSDFSKKSATRRRRKSRRLFQPT